MGTPDSSHHHLIAQLQLPCCSFSISAWNRTRGKAGNSEQCPTAVCGCSVPLSLLGGLCSTPAADPLPCPVPVPAGAILCWHQGSWTPCWSSPWGLPECTGRRRHIPPAGVVLGVGGGTHGEGLFTAILLVPLESPVPCFCLGGCWGNTHGWTKLWALIWDRKGYPKMTVLPCKKWGDAQLRPYLPHSTWSCSLLTPE